MEGKDLIKGIRNDLLTQTIPLVGAKSLAAVYATGSISQIADFKDEIGDAAAKNVTKIFAKNVSTYIVTNLYKKNLTFDKKLAIRVSTSSFATLCTKVFFAKEKDYKQLVLVPLLDGAVSGASFLIENHKEASRYFRAYHPQLYQDFNDGCKMFGIDSILNWAFRLVDGE